jgi:hypothetical protein
MPRHAISRFLRISARLSNDNLVDREVAERLERNQTDLIANYTDMISCMIDVFRGCISSVLWILRFSTVLKKNPSEAMMYKHISLISMCCLKTCIICLYVKLPYFSFYYPPF